MVLVWISPPLLRGLKHENIIVRPEFGFVWISPPLLRGLKPESSNSTLRHNASMNLPASIKRIETCLQITQPSINVFVWISPPLLRGLKLEYLPWRGLFGNTSMNLPASIKRIETISAGASVAVGTSVVWISPPLLRGLKLSLSSGCVPFAARVWISPPLLRGLKPVGGEPIYWYDIKYESPRLY